MRGRLFKIESGVKLAHVLLRTASGSARDFPVDGKIIIFALNDAEREGILHVEAGSPSGTLFKTDVPENDSTFSIDVPDNPNPRDEPTQKPQVLVNWRAVGLAGGLVALFGAAAFLLGRDDDDETPIVPNRTENKVREITEGSDGE